MFVVVGIGYGGLGVQLINLDQASGAKGFLIGGLLHLAFLGGVVWLASSGFAGTSYEPLILWCLYGLALVALVMLLGTGYLALKRKAG